LEEIVSQVVLQRGGRDPDFRGRFVFDVEPLLDHMTSEWELRPGWCTLKTQPLKSVFPSDEQEQLKEEVAKLHKDVTDAKREAEAAFRAAQETFAGERKHVAEEIESRDIQIKELAVGD